MTATLEDFRTRTNLTQVMLAARLNDDWKPPTRDLRQRMAFWQLEALLPLMETGGMAAIGFALSHHEHMHLAILGPQMFGQVYTGCHEDHFEWEFDEWADPFLVELLFGMQDWDRDIVDLLPLTHAGQCDCDSHRDFAGECHVMVLTTAAIRDLLTEWEQTLFASADIQGELF